MHVNASRSSYSQIAITCIKFHRTPRCRQRTIPANFCSPFRLFIEEKTYGNFLSGTNWTKGKNYSQHSDIAHPPKMLLKTFYQQRNGISNNAEHTEFLASIVVPFTQAETKKKYWHSKKQRTRANEWEHSSKRPVFQTRRKNNEQNSSQHHNSCICNSSKNYNFPFSYTSWVLPRPVVHIQPYFLVYTHSHLPLSIFFSLLLLLLPVLLPSINSFEFQIFIIFSSYFFWLSPWARENS